MIKTLEVKVVYENEFVIIRDDIVRFPSGKIGTYYYSQWKSPHGVAVIIMIEKKILLLRNYRYSEQAYSLEIPQGFGTFGSSPEADARRELMEETGLQPDHLVPVMTFGALYQTHLFLWRVDALPALIHDGQEQTEAISGHELLELDNLDLAALNRRGVHDPITISAILIAQSLANDSFLSE